MNPQLASTATLRYRFRMWSDNEYDTVIAKVRRDGDVSAAHTHYFRGDLVLLEMSVNVVKRDGTVAQYASPEIWSLGLEIIE